MKFRSGLTLVRLPTCCRLRIPVLGSGQFLKPIAWLREPFCASPHLHQWCWPSPQGFSSVAPLILLWLGTNMKKWRSRLHDSR